MKAHVLSIMRTAFGNGILGVCCLLINTGRPLLGAVPPQSGGGVLVFAPHPDDAELGCSGIILQAHARGEQVHVVTLTSGDGANMKRLPPGDTSDEPTVKDYLATSRLRQLQSKRSIAVLGLKPDSLILLGYPDGGLEALYQNTATVPFTSPTTHKNKTYAFVQRDYHSSKYGVPAPYTRKAILGDIADLITNLKPSRIYVTSEFDAHPDHRTAYFLVRDAIRTTGYTGALYTYLIHGSHVQWPWPRGATPQSPFELPPNTSQAAFPLPWPPDERIPLSPRQAHLKLLAIRCHKLPFLNPVLNVKHETNMESFVKSEEIFWEPLSHRR